MIAVDTNVLVFAHRTEAPLHQEAVGWLVHLAEGGVPWGLPVFCLGEFVRVVTHRNLFAPPSTLDQATAALTSLLASPSIRVLNPGAGFFAHFQRMLQAGSASGNLAFDAQIAAVCREHGVDTLLTDDRDFARFPQLATLSPATSPGSAC